MDARNSSVASALCWWAEGLRCTLPDWLSELVFGPSEILKLYVFEERAILRLDSVEDTAQVFDIPIKYDPKSGALSTTGTRAVARSANIEAKETILCLPQSQVLSTQIDLPARSALQLRAAVRNDLDRFTPFSVDDSYFDAMITRVDTENEKIKVTLQVAQIADVERVMAFAQSIGLRPTRVTSSDAVDETNLNLLPEERRNRPKRFLPKAIQTMSIAFVCIVAIHSVLLYMQKSAAIEKNQSAIKQLRSVAVAAADMEDRLADFQAASAIVESEKQAHPSALEALDIVTKDLTDQTFLIAFELLGGTLTLTGFSADPTKMLLRLEQSEKLRNGRFAAPTTLDPRTGLNRFIVEVDFTGGVPG